MEYEQKRRGRIFFIPQEYLTLGLIIVLGLALFGGVIFISSLGSPANPKPSSSPEALSPPSKLPVASPQQVQGAVSQPLKPQSPKPIKSSLSPTPSPLPSPSSQPSETPSPTPSSTPSLEPSPSPQPSESASPTPSESPNP